MRNFARVQFGQLPPKPFANRGRERYNGLMDEKKMKTKQKYAATIGTVFIDIGKLAIGSLIFGSVLRGS